MMAYFVLYSNGDESFNTCFGQIILEKDRATGMTLLVYKIRLIGAICLSNPRGQTDKQTDKSKCIIIALLSRSEGNKYERLSTETTNN